MKTETPMTPRGSRRILYVSDPSSIAGGLLPDPVEADDLRGWVDMLADSGVDMLQQDVYAQGFTFYWRSDKFEYGGRPQHKRFLPLLDAGVQPLQLLLEHSHERGMAFFAGFRMNDNHGHEHFPRPTKFNESHPECRLAGPGAAHDPDQRMLDFTFDDVRQYVFEAMEVVVSRFDVDGIELTFREDMYFPVEYAEERAHLMTDLVRRLRGMLDEHSKSRGKRRQLGARVYASLDECTYLGLDVATWVTEGLIDFLCPMDPMYVWFNAPYAKFAALTRQGECMLFPGTAPWSSEDARRRIHFTAERHKPGSASMTRSNDRALAHTFYGAGADGISIYNHFVGHLQRPPFYPQALQVFHELRDPEKITGGDRHYLFEPTREDQTHFAYHGQRVVLERSALRLSSGQATKPSGVFRFRLYEQRDQVHHATLMVRGSLTQHDEVAVQLNGVPMASGPLGETDVRYSIPLPEVRWYPVPPAAIAWGENELSITLEAADPEAAGEIVIDEVEVWVEPK